MIQYFVVVFLEDQLFENDCLFYFDRIFGKSLLESVFDLEGLFSFVGHTLTRMQSAYDELFCGPPQRSPEHSQLETTVMV